MKILAFKAKDNVLFGTSYHIFRNKKTKGQEIDDKIYGTDRYSYVKECYGRRKRCFQKNIAKNMDLLNKLVVFYGTEDIKYTAGVPFFTSSLMIHSN